MKILKCTRRRTTAVVAVKGGETALKPYTLLRTEPTTTEGKVLQSSASSLSSSTSTVKERERERERGRERGNAREAIKIYKGKRRIEKEEDNKNYYTVTIN